ncbi:MAG: hypothetical protein EOO61_07910 [Hymenobacter sp.]|nr:MAG: hypothetical protein EOO61_07910 [Hymenobacter sp.]
MAIECLNEMMMEHNIACSLIVAQQPQEANEALERLDHALFRMHAILGFNSGKERILISDN